MGLRPDVIQGPMSQQRRGCRYREFDFREGLGKIFPRDFLADIVTLPKGTIVYLLFAEYRRDIGP